MKTRLGFVSNSSSTSFLITNISSEEKTLRDFVMENTHLVEQFNKEYSSDESLDDVIKDAENSDKVFHPGREVSIAFGDEDGTTIGRVFDYILRDGGSSKSFTWEFEEYLR
jgi:hypothetical protein